MGKIKVLLAIRPRMIADVVRHFVERQPDMAVIYEVIDLTELVSAIRTTGAEVVILTLGDAGRAAACCRPLLAAYPHLKIMALAAAGGAAFLYQSGSPPTRFDDVGVEAMLRTIRASRR